MKDWIRFLLVSGAVGSMLGGGVVQPASAAVCNNTVKANVVALDQQIMFNRLGAVNPVGEMFALRSDDFIVQWQAVRAGLGIGFVAKYMARTDPDVLPVLAEQLKVPPLPMWLAVHREIRSNPRIRAVFDFLAEAMPSVL